ncbi:FAD-dependent monooxygenase [Actinoplanes xinjiangensis]|uniref:FAD-dependent monooxygenase n=1 Tax=Actinoplanes xinjiangensis TaxID=512350 RepID=UPI00343DC776
MPENHPVLVVGAGPVGLTAAAILLGRGVDVRVIDRAPAPSEFSKALLVWPRTLEVLRRLGGGRHIAEHGQDVADFRYWSDGRPVCRIPFGAATRPKIIIQPDVEAMLHAALAERGGKPEWQTSLTGLTQDADGVTATLREPDGGTRTHRFSHVIGADGAGSTVRGLLGLDFAGATYPQTFVLGDTAVEGASEPASVHYYLSPRGVLVLVPLPNGRHRVFTAAPGDLTSDEVTLELLQELVDTRGPGGLRLHDLSWSAAFRIHARHVERPRDGRVFLAGDAAHIHSPAGGQGLNTGVTDAHNLAWKLAAVWHGDLPATVLDSYEPERAAVARSVVRQAEAQTRAWLLRKPWQVAARDLAASAAARTGVFDRHYVPWLTGARHEYPAGPAVAPQSRGGRRPVRHGALIPNVAVSTDGDVWRPIRDVLPDDRYTLLVTVPDGVDPRPGPAFFGLLRAYPRLISGWARSGTLLQPAGDLPGGTPAGRVAVTLIRPDHYVAVHDTDPALPAITRHLAALTRPGKEEQ